MAEVKHQFVVKRDMDSVWRFAEDIKNFAGCLPGFKSCDVQNDKTSLWVLSAKMGPFDKTLQLKCDITEFIPGQQFKFDLTGVNEPVRGKGEFYTKPVDDNTVQIDFALNLSGKGPMAGMMDALARPLIAQMAQAFAKSLTEKLEAAAC